MSLSVAQSPFYIQIAGHERIPVSKKLCLELPVLSDALLDSKKFLSMEDVSLSEAAKEVFQALNQNEPSRFLSPKIECLEPQDAEQLFHFLDKLQGTSQPTLFDCHYLLAIKEQAAQAFDSAETAYAAIEAGQDNVRGPGFSLKKEADGYHLKISPSCDQDRFLASLGERASDVKSLHWLDNANESSHVSDLKWLENFSSLNKLCIESEFIRSFEGLESCLNLEHLTFEEVPLSPDIEAHVGTLSALKTLTIADCHGGSKIENWSFLSRVQSLEQLTLCGLTLSSLEFLSLAPNLTSLKMESSGKTLPRYKWNQLPDFAKKLEKIEFISCGVERLSWVNRLSTLKELVCHYCPIKSIEGLWEHPSLVSLDLQGCQAVPATQWEKLEHDGHCSKKAAPCKVPHPSEELRRHPDVIRV